MPCPAARGRRRAGLVAPRPRCSRGFVLVTAGVVASGGGLPGDGAAQDTASAANSAWIGIRFNEETRAAPGPGEASYALVVRDVYGNGPADRVGIRPGDWFVTVDGNPLHRYEAWLRATSDLGPGQPLTVRLVRDSGERELVVVAGRRPRYIQPHPLYRLEFETVQARLDSLFDLFLGAGPRAEQWPGFHSPHISVPRGFGFDSGILRVTTSDSGLRAEGNFLAAPGEETRVFPPRESRPDSRDGPEIPLERRTLAGTGSEAEPGRAGTVTVVLGGAVVRDLAAELGRYFGVAAGVLVTDVVDPATPAAQAGFRPGDIIVSVEDRQVENLLAFRRVLAEEDPPIEITVVRRGKALKLAYPSR